MRDALLVVDVGTSAVRAMVLSVRGEVCASASRPVATMPGRDGAVVLDDAAMWAAVREAVRTVTESHQVASIGLAAQLGVALLDARGEPVLAPMTWADRRGDDVIRQLGPEVHRMVRARAGRRPSPELLALKLAWLRDTDPVSAARVRWAVSLKDRLLQRLTGRIVTDETHASYTLIYDVAQRRWSVELAAAFGIDVDVLPPVFPATSSLELAPHAADALGLPPGLPVAVGGPDGTVGAVGAGAVSDGTTVDIAGSTDVVVHVTDQPLVDDEAAAVLNAHAAPRRWTLGGPTGLTGGGVRHLLASVGQDDIVAAHVDLGAEAAALPAGSDGLTVLTTLGGSRFPHWRPDLAGALVGLREEHTAAHLLRASHEGAAFLVLDGLDALERLGRRVEEVVVVGGVAAGHEWLQVRADAWQRPVVRLEESEATSMGAAMLAGVAGGQFDDLEDGAQQLVRRAGRIEPRAATGRGMAAARRRWQHLVTG